jgi:uncharacterized membrane protein
MTAPPVWKRGFASLSAVLVVVMVVGSAHAEVVFRKKAPPADNAEAAPSGGEVEGSTEAAPAKTGAEGEAPGPSATQADDKDFPEAQAQRDKARADAALQRQMKNAELAKERERGTPWYKESSTWWIAGGVVVGAVLLFIGGSAILHQMNGGDVRGCNMTMFGMNCFGEGRPQ